MSIRALLVCHTNFEPHAIRSEMAQIEGLWKAGVALELVTQEDTYYANYFAQLGIPVHGGYPTSKWDRVAIAGLRKRLQKGQFQVVHAFETKGIAAAATAARNLPVRVIAYRGSAGFYWYDPTAWLSVLHPRIDRLLCVSDHVRDHARRQLWRDKDKAVTVYKGQDCSWYEGQLGSALLDPSFFWVACSARWSRVKGVRYFIEAMQFIPNELPIKFVVFGSKTDGKHARALAAKWGVQDRILLLGHRSDALSLLASAQCAVQPSLSEGLSRSMLEAMCLGVPLVASEAGGIPELIAHEQNGLLVPPAAPKAIAEAVLRYWHSAALREALAQEARKTVRTKFSVARTVKETLRYYVEGREK